MKINGNYYCTETYRKLQYNKYKKHFLKYTFPGMILPIN
jgi:hypothetical protein